MRCYLCGRQLLHAAATLTTPAGTGQPGPTCARRAGLLPPVVRSGPRLFSPRRRLRGDGRQMEIGA